MGSHSSTNIIHRRHISVPRTEFIVLSLLYARIFEDIFTTNHAFPAKNDTSACGINHVLLTLIAQLLHTRSQKHLVLSRNSSIYWASTSLWTNTAVRSLISGLYLIQRQLRCVPVSRFRPLPWTHLFQVYRRPLLLHCMILAPFSQIPPPPIQLLNLSVRNAPPPNCARGYRVVQQHPLVFVPHPCAAGTEHLDLRAKIETKSNLRASSDRPKRQAILSGW